MRAPGSLENERKRGENHEEAVRCAVLLSEECEFDLAQTVFNCSTASFVCRV